MRFHTEPRRHSRGGRPGGCIHALGGGETRTTMDTSRDNTPNYARWLTAGAAMVFALGALWGAAQQMIA